MNLDFRQGIVRYQRDLSTQVPIFLQPSNGGSNIDLIVSPNPLEVAFANDDTDFLHTEASTILSAFTGFVSGIDYWLYIDIHPLTGERTFGYTTTEFIKSNSPPLNPVIGQHWWRSNKNIMNEWNGSSWVERLRVFLAKYDNAAVIDPYPIGSQVNITNANIKIGHILFDEDDKPVRKFKRRGLGPFLTTVSVFATYTAKSANVSFEVSIDVAEAVEPIPIYHLVSFDSENFIRLASHLDPSRSVIGMVAEDFSIGEVGRYITQGHIVNVAWNWTSPPGTLLFCGPTGEITTSVPQTGAAQRVGMIISADQIYLDIEPQLKYQTPTFANLVPAQFDKVTGNFYLSDSATVTDTSYQFEQTIPSNLWNVAHNLGTDIVNVQVYVDNKLVLPSEIEIIDINTVQVSFGSSQVVGRVNITTT